jgi:hypothetical protein
MMPLTCSSIIQVAVTAVVDGRSGVRATVGSVKVSDRARELYVRIYCCHSSSLYVRFEGEVVVNWLRSNGCVTC